MKHLFLSILFLLFTCIVFSQARSSIGIGGSIQLMPFNQFYNTGYGVALQGNIKVASRWTVEPVASLETYPKSRTKILSDPDGKKNVSIAVFRLLGKYYFTKNIFAGAGPGIYASSGNGMWGAAVFPGGEVGYRLQLGKQNDLEFSVSGGPAVGIRAVYCFNFKKL